MDQDNDHLKAQGASPNEEAIEPLFSAFKPKPRPAPRPAPAKAEPPREKPVPAPPAPQAQPALEARLAELEKKLKESALREQQEGDKDVLVYLKSKLGELEDKLRDSQEKALAFAFELKGREEARKESRHEMEEFLSAVKKQQSAAEAERLHALDMERARERIEALEKRLLELSSEPPVAGGTHASRFRETPAPPVKGPHTPVEHGDKTLPQTAITELSGLRDELYGRLRAEVEGFAAAAKVSDEQRGQALSEELARSLSNEISGLRAELRRELQASQQALSCEIKECNNRLACAVTSELDRLRAELTAVAKAGDKDLGKAFAASLDKLRGEVILDVEQKMLGERPTKLEERLQSIPGLIDEALVKMGDSLTARLQEVQAALGRLSSEIVAAETGYEKNGNGLRMLLERKGREEADKLAGAYDFGFIQASLDNLEKSFADALQNLSSGVVASEARAGTTPPEIITGHNAAALSAAIKEISDALAGFKRLRAEAAKGMKRRLTGG